MEDYKPLKQGNLVDEVFATIKQDIFRGKLEPGDILPTQEKLAKQFGVSRTVIREAQKKLASLGLIENRQGSGTYISRPQMDELIAPSLQLVELGADSAAELMEARFHVELTVSRLAAQRVDKEQIERLKEIHNRMIEKVNQGEIEEAIQSDIDFHMELASISRNRVLARMLAVIREMTYRFLQSFYRLPGASERGVRDHLLILKAIEAKDPDLAERQMESHFEAINKNIEIYFKPQVELPEKDKH